MAKRDNTTKTPRATMGFAPKATDAALLRTVADWRAVKTQGESLWERFKSMAEGEESQAVTGQLEDMGNRQYALVQQVKATCATTAEGVRAKAEVLLAEMLIADEDFAGTFAGEFALQFVRELLDLERP